MRAYIETYGCMLNVSNEEIMKGILERRGCGITDNPDLADTLILNSCSASRPAEKISEEKISNWKREYPGKEIVFAGCMPYTEYGMSKDLLPESSFVGPNNCRDIAKVVEKTSSGDVVEYLDDRKEKRTGLPRIRRNSLVDICDIKHGFPGGCPLDPLSSGSSTESYMLEDIVDEVKRALDSGCKEIWIAAHNTASYGEDIETSLKDLVDSIVNLPGRFRLRIGTMNVDTAKAKNLMGIYRSDKVYSYIHLPLLSGSDRILDDMGVKYKSQDFVELVDRLKSNIPDINISTDIVLGYPGEKQMDFKRTKEVVKSTEPDSIEINMLNRPNSTEEGKNSLEGQEILDIVSGISSEKNRDIIGKKREVLVVGRGDRGMPKGRDMSYRELVVDSSRRLIGKFVDSEIVDSPYGPVFKPII